MALVITLGTSETFNVGLRKFVVEGVAAEDVSIREVGGGVVVLDLETPMDVGDGLTLRQGPRVLAGRVRIGIDAPRSQKVWRNAFNLDAPLALLASVPLEHLEAGLDTQTAVGRVAFGSRAVDTFMTLKEELGDDPCQALIYASDEGGGPPTITWAATFLRTVGARASGAHPDGDRYRPRSTKPYREDEAGSWLLFWEVTDLRRLPAEQQRRVSTLRGFGKKTPYQPTFVPHGPLAISVPQ